MRFIERLKRIVLGNKYSSESYIEYLRGLGVKIGDNSRFYNVEYALVDVTRPYLIEIGTNVKLTKGITILTHDYAWSVIKNKYGNVMGSAGKVRIGNNVFVGVNTTILKGVTIGDNVIIGAGSVVSKDIPSDCVAIGSPARPVMTLEEYYNRRISSQEKEAKELIMAYMECFGRKPVEDDLKDFFWLFTDVNDNIHPLFEKNMRLCGSEDISYRMFEKNVKKYADMTDMIDHIIGKSIDNSEF